MFQKAIFLLVVWWSLWTVALPTLADTLHTIVVADTGNWQGGRSFGKDLDRIKDLVRTVSTHTRLELQLHEISGNDVNSNNVITTVENLSVESRDVIFFHYAGHGGRTSDKSTLWPFMDIKGGAVDLERVKSTLQQKNPRFLIILADTCNNFDNSLNPVWSRGGSSSRGMPSSDGYRQLFLNYRGHVFASGSKPGQYSWGNDERGGFFTDAFLNNLNNELASSNPNWYTIMKRTDAPIEVGGKKQHPQSQVNISPIHGGSGPTPDQCYYFYKPNGILCCKTATGTTCDSDNDQSQQEACPPGGLFMKPGGITCCRRSTGITCDQ